MLSILMFVAVPVKYLAGEPAFVQIMGPIHGFLFLTFCVMLYLGAGKDWTFKGFIHGGISAVVPFGPFWWDKQLGAGKYDVDGAEVTE